MKKLTTALIAGAFALATTAAFAQTQTPNAGAGNSSPSGSINSSSRVNKDDSMSNTKAKHGANDKMMKKDQTTGSSSGSAMGNSSDSGSSVKKQ